MSDEKRISRYNNLDGLRAIGSLGIIAMHVRANADYQCTGYVFDNIIPALTSFVYLFLIISGFGMFCGYYEKFKKGEVDLNRFYLKRYKKLIPFFAFLLLIDAVMERSGEHLIEVFTELTLVFGLLPNNNPNAIGVCWTLGVIFLFYMLMPFFVFLCHNRKRAFFSLAVSLVLVFFCDSYYLTEKFVIESFIPRHSFIYCAPYFLGGACLYMCREEIIRFVNRFRWPVLIFNIAFTVFYFMTPVGITGVHMAVKHLVFFGCWIGYLISVESKLLQMGFFRYMGSIGLEMYLAHMVVFRVLEKAGLLYLFGKGAVSYLFVFVLTVALLVLFIWVYTLLFGKTRDFINSRLSARRIANGK